MKLSIRQDSEEKMKLKVYSTCIIIIILGLSACTINKKYETNIRDLNSFSYTHNDSIIIEMGYTLVNYTPCEQEKEKGIWGTEMAFRESVKNCPSHSSWSEQDIDNYIEESYQHLIEYLKQKKNE